MYELKVSNKSYKVRFCYRVLAETDLIDRVIAAGDMPKTEAGESPAAAIVRGMVSLTADLLLAGLQKNHADEFGYETEDEKAAALDKVYDLIDDYEDESYTGEDGLTHHDAVELFGDLQDELMARGFLSRLAAMGQAAEAQKTKKKTQKTAKVTPIPATETTPKA